MEQLINDQMKHPTIEKSDRSLDELAWYDRFEPSGNGVFKVEARLVDDNSINISGLSQTLFHILEGCLDTLLIDIRGDWGGYFLDVEDEIIVENYLRTSYQEMLVDGRIDPEYEGACKCNDWLAFFEFAFETVVKKEVLYSPLFFSLEHNLVFYMHHSGEIGIYYTKPNLCIENLTKRIIAAGGAILN